MKKSTRIVIGLALLMAVAALLLPRLVRRIDSAVAPAMEKAAALEAQYRDMTNTYVIAAEMPPEHPAYRRWSECRTALLEAGYIETRELRLKQNLAAKGAVPEFFKAFQARFPGVERSVRETKSDAPVVTVTARKSDFGPLGAIERFVSQYEPRP